MRTTITATILIAAALLAACGTAADSCSGVVGEATTNTLTLILDDGEVLTFATHDAARDGYDGRLHAGSPAEVFFIEAPRDGFGTATRISAPADYNLLVGSWIEPNPADPTLTQGFSLFAGGEAESVNMLTLLVERWSVSDGVLTLGGRSIGNGQTIDFTEEWRIEHLDDKHLTLRSGDLTRRLTRTKYPL